MAQRRRGKPRRRSARRSRDAANASSEDEDWNHNRIRNQQEVMEVEQDQADECIPSDDPPQPQREPADAPDIAEADAKEAVEEKQAEPPAPAASQNCRGCRRGQPLPNEYIPDATAYQRAWHRNAKKLTNLFQNTCAQNKQLRFMLFFDGRRIGVENAADIHWSPCYVLPCNAEMVCQRKCIIQQYFFIYFFFHCPTMFFHSFHFLLSDNIFYNVCR